MRDMTRNRTRNQRAARWAEFWVIMAVCGFLTLIFMLGMCVAFAVVQAAWIVAIFIYNFIIYNLRLASTTSE